MLQKTRLSLLYVATYLSLTGIGFLLVPQLSLYVFFSNVIYDSTFIRVSGAFLIVLSIFVIQVIRYRLEILYKTIIAVRLFLMAVWLFLYMLTGNPLFLIFLGVVGLGVALSIIGFLLDRKNSLL